MLPSRFSGFHPFTVPLARSNVLNTASQTCHSNFGALIGASSEESELFKIENEQLKIENEQLKRQIAQLKESTKKPTDQMDTLEAIIEERDEDIDTLKKEIDGGAAKPSG